MHTVHVSLGVWNPLNFHTMHWWGFTRLYNCVGFTLFIALTIIKFLTYDILFIVQRLIVCVILTCFRSTAFGIQSVLGRLGSILGNLSFGRLITVDPFIPILMVAALLIFGGLVGFLLPNPRGESTFKALTKCARLCRRKSYFSPCCRRTTLPYANIQTDSKTVT